MPGDPALKAALPVILAPVGYYPPAYRAGGPTRSVPAIVEQLSDEFAFRIITRDRDLGVGQRMAGVVPDRWVRAGPADCLYLSPRRLALGGIASALRRTRHDVLYLNSVFSVQFTLGPLLMRKVGLLRSNGLVIAPRGELDDEALGLKRRRKRLYLALLSALRLVDGAVWHAATPDEAVIIRRFAGSGPRIHVARDIPVRGDESWTPPVKQPGSLDVVFLGRIARIKNLDLAIAALGSVRGSVTFTVYGPIEDRQYWEECLRRADDLPSGVAMRYGGVVEPDMVHEVLARHHLFLLPTRGESFGHAIVEALVAGRPVLISDQTPWRGLAARSAGWDLPLAGMGAFSATLQRCVDMTGAEYTTWADGARQMGLEIVEDPELDSAYRSMFRDVLDGAPSPDPASAVSR